MASFRLDRDELEGGIAVDLMQNSPITLFRRLTYFREAIDQLTQLNFTVPLFDCRS